MSKKLQIRSTWNRTTISRVVRILSTNTTSQAAIALGVSPEIVRNIDKKLKAGTELSGKKVAFKFEIEAAATMLKKSHDYGTIIKNTGMAPASLLKVAMIKGIATVEMGERLKSFVPKNNHIADNTIIDAIQEIKSKQILDNAKLGGINSDNILMRAWR